MAKSSGPESRWRDRLAITGMVIAMVVLAPLWFPLHLVGNAIRERRGRRILRRADGLPAVLLDIEGSDLVLRGAALMGQARWTGRERIPLAELVRGDWWSLDEDGGFAAANSPPTDVVRLETTAGEPIEICCGWDDWGRRERVIPVLVERGILHPRPSFEGSRPGLHSLLTAGGFVLAIGVIGAACVGLLVTKRC